MLTALGTFLNTLVVPLTHMGTAMQMNLQAYEQAYGPGGYDGQAMSTVAFNIFAGPWIDQLGQLSVGLGTFLQSTVTFLIGLKTLL